MLRSSEALKKAVQPYVIPFDLLSQKPLYHMEILQSTDGRLYLFTDFHHLIFDGTSYNLFLKHLAASLAGKKLQAEKCDFFTFAQTQHAWATAQHNETADSIHGYKLYWDSRMTVTDEMTRLPYDLYDTCNSTGEEHSVTASIDPASLYDFAQQTGIRPSAVYLAAALYAIHVFTGSDCIGITTVSSGRQRVEIAGSYGMFVNTLPFTAKISEGSIHDFLKQIQQTFDEDIVHDSYPFSSIAADYHIVPEIMFAYQETLFDALGEGSPLQTVNLEQGTAKFPLYIDIEGDRHQTDIRVRYDSNKYTQPLMQTFTNTIQMIAMQMASSPIDAILEAMLLTDEQQELRLDCFNNHSFPLTETNETVVSMFRDAAEKWPDHIAVVYGDKRYTYQALDALTDKMAGYLLNKISAVQRPEDPVIAILIPRSENMVLLSLAVLKIGIPYQPIDPLYPEERISYMLKDTNAMLLTTEEMIGKLSVPPVQTITVTELLDAPPSMDELPTPTPDSLFTILYTSGSTGIPKGIMLEHRNLVSFIKWYHAFYSLSAQDSVAAYASYGFDANMMDMYPALTCGASVHIIPEEHRLDLSWIEHYYQQQGITHSFMTTQVGFQFAQHYHPEALKYLSVGGEKLNTITPPVGYQLINGYGPTECTIFSTVQPVVRREENIPIGKPVSGVNCYVMDKHLRRLPIGAIGELIIVGSQVSRGYLNLPAKTAESFSPIRGNAPIIPVIWFAIVRMVIWNFLAERIPKSRFAVSELNFKRWKKPSLIIQT